MACGPNVLGLNHLRAFVTVSLLAVGLVPSAGQPRLAQPPIGVRNLSEVWRAVQPGAQIAVKGIVNSQAFHFPGYSLLAIQEGGQGAILHVPAPDTTLDSYQPGDELQVEGVVSILNSMPVIVPRRLSAFDHKPPPEPLDVPLEDLISPRYLGRLVRTEARIKDFGPTAAGEFISLEAPGSYKIFIPRRIAQSAGRGSIIEGDHIRATGVAYQFNGGYQLLINDPAVMVRTESRWLPPPVVVAAALCGVLLISYMLWNRERRLSGQRETLRSTYQLGEEILGSSSSQNILKRISESLPSILGVSRVRLYVYNRAGKTLDAVSADGGESVSISLSSPPAGSKAGAVACFHYRTLLVIPDIDRSPFPMGGKSEDEPVPRSLLFVPMLAQGEMVGVLELDQDDRIRDFTAGEQELAQHLANQIGVAIRLLDQRSVQEQLFRTEKLAAVGRLISGVVNELQAPLSSISDLANQALEKCYGDPGEREVGAIAAEAQKAAAIVARLVSFAAAEQVEARPVPINSLLASLIEFREADWKASGIRVRDLTSREPLYVLGSQGQLEQVFLNLLVHAEQSLADAAQKVITIRTSVLARRLLLEISFSAQPQSRTPEETAAVLAVTRSVIGGHGGEVRLIEKAGNDPRFEVELPVTVKERVAASTAAQNGHPGEVARRMTALVIESDDAAQRQILAMLTGRGWRVVPVDNSDTGLELAQRMRFDVALCSVHAPGLNWVELSERMQLRVGAFVLLSDGYDAELSADFEGDGRFVLAKPLQEAELERVLRTLDPGEPVIKNGAA